MIKRQRYKSLWCCILIIIIIIFCFSHFSCNRNQRKILRQFLNPPQLSKTEEESLANNSSMDKLLLLEQLSNIVQNQLKLLQTPTFCEGPHIICGHFQKCGFGCQVHHRVACLMISYALSIPLIHDDTEGWPFSKRWNDIFEPLGSRCTPGNNTFRWSWKEETTALETPCLSSSDTLEIAYPLWEGIPVSKKLGDLVDQIHPNPLLWWVGQFMKFALTLRTDFQENFEFQKMKIGFNHPIVGFHVRRTDKIKESPESHHEIMDYMAVASELLQNVQNNSNFTKTVFIASDDSRVLPDTQKKYPDWNVIGFQATETFETSSDRGNGFEDIVNDILALADCDYVVCGLSSNVCRLLLEIFSFKYLDSKQRIASLDGSYMYYLHAHTIRNPIVIKVDA